MKKILRKKLRIEIDLLLTILYKIVGIILPFILIRIIIDAVGLKEYAIVAYILLLQSVISIFNFGLSPSASYLINKYSPKDVIKTIEIVYFIVGVVFFLIVYKFTLITKIGNINVSGYEALIILSLITTWPISLYYAFGVGIGKTKIVTKYYTFGLVIKNLLACVAVLYLDETITVYLLCNITGNIIIVLLLRMIAGFGGTFSIEIIITEKKYIISMMLFTWLSLLSTQIDKQISLISLSTEEFALYSVLTTIVYGYVNFSNTINAYFFKQNIHLGESVINKRISQNLFFCAPLLIIPIYPETVANFFSIGYEINTELYLAFVLTLLVVCTNTVMYVYNNLAVTKKSIVLQLSIVIVISISYVITLPRMLVDLMLIVIVSHFLTILIWYLHEKISRKNSF